MDSLRAPREKDQKFWDWRRESPIRPVVFEDPGVVTEEVVQLHLEQRVSELIGLRWDDVLDGYLTIDERCVRGDWAAPRAKQAMPLSR